MGKSVTKLEPDEAACRTEKAYSGTPGPRLRHRPPESEFHLLEGAGVSNPGPPVQQYRGPGGGGHPEEAGQRGEGVQLGHGQHVHSGAQLSSLP